MILVIDTRNVIESITLRVFDNFIDNDKEGVFSSNFNNWPNLTYKGGKYAVGLINFFLSLNFHRKLDIVSSPTEIATKKP